MRAGGEKVRAAGVGPCMLVLVAASLLLSGSMFWAGACSDGAKIPQATSSSTPSTAASAVDVEGTVGEAIKIGHAIVTVWALEPTFNPVTPEQRLSEQPPTSPGGDESFYQAYVKVENDGTMPLRVDPEDFACAVGNAVVGIEPTWSGPAARSLLENSSLDLLVTFKAQAGYEPVLLYSPPWYDGTIRVRPVPSESTETT